MPNTSSEGLSSVSHIIKLDLLLKLLSVCVVPLFLYLRSVESNIINLTNRVETLEERVAEDRTELNKLRAKVNTIDLSAREAIVSLKYVDDTLTQLQQRINGGGVLPPAPLMRSLGQRRHGK